MSSGIFGKSSKRRRLRVHLASTDALSYPSYIARQIHVHLFTRGSRFDRKPRLELRPPLARSFWVRSRPFRESSRVAIPHAAITHLGSSLSTVSKFILCFFELKEWSKAIPVSNRCQTVGLGDSERDISSATRVGGAYDIDLERSRSKFCLPVEE